MSIFPSELKGRLWHTTSIPSFDAILACGYILPNPPIPDSSRHGTGDGPKHHPYVRTLGGISVFDFLEFNVRSYAQSYGSHLWATFVPCWKWDAAVWISIDPEKVAENLIRGQVILDRWKADESVRGHNFIPLIEGAHLGPIHVSAIDDVLVYVREEGRFKQHFAFQDLMLKRP